MRRLFLTLAISIVATLSHAADNRTTTRPSRYSVDETVERLQAAMRKREAAGFVVVTVIDHALGDRNSAST